MTSDLVWHYHLHLTHNTEIVDSDFHEDPLVENTYDNVEYGIDLSFDSITSCMTTLRIPYSLMLKDNYLTLILQVKGT